MGIREGLHKIICEVQGYSGVWNPKVTRTVQARMAKWLGSKVKEGRTTELLRRKGAGRELLGKGGSNGTECRNGGRSWHCSW